MAIATTKANRGGKGFDWGGYFDAQENAEAPSEFGVGVFEPLIVSAAAFKTKIGLDHVDNTSDAEKWSAQKTLTNTDINCLNGINNVYNIPITAIQGYQYSTLTLTNPGADRIPFWDFSSNTFDWMDPTGLGGSPDSIAAFMGTSTVRGIAKEIHIAIRSDNEDGTGTPEDPFGVYGADDAAKATKFDSLMRANNTNHVHLQKGTVFLTDGIYDSANNKGWTVGDGMWISGHGATIRQRATPQYWTSAAAKHVVIGNSYTSVVSRVLIEDLTVDANWQNLDHTSTGTNKAIAGIGLYVDSHNTCRNVRVTNTYGDTGSGQECFSANMFGGYGITSTDNWFIDCTCDTPRGDYCDGFGLFGWDTDNIMTNSGVVRPRVFGIPGGQKFNPAGAGMAYMVDGQITNGLFVDCVQGIYGDTAWAEGHLLAHNVIKNCQSGIYWATDGAYLKRMRLIGNVVDGATYIPIALSVTGSGNYLDDILIENNVIKASSLNYAIAVSVGGGATGNNVRLINNDVTGTVNISPTITGVRFENICDSNRKDSLIGSLKIQGTFTVGDDPDSNWFFRLDSSYTIDAGDRLQFEVYSDENNPTHSPCTNVFNTSPFLNVGPPDQNGLSISSGNLVREYACGRWYFRDVDLTAYAGHAVESIALGEGSITQSAFNPTGTYTYYYRNIVIVGADGTAKKKYYTSDTKAPINTFPTTNSTGVSYTVNYLGSTESMLSNLGGTTTGINFLQCPNPSAPRIPTINSSNGIDLISLGAGESIRRNAGDTAFEAYTPAAAVTVGPYESVRFTPTIAGWYRIIESIGSAMSLSCIAGEITVSNFENNNGTDVQFQYAVGGYSTDLSINQTRWMHFLGGPIDQARVSTDGDVHTYVDIHVQGVDTGHSYNDIIVEHRPSTFYRHDLVASPVVGATVGSGVQKTLTFADGFATTDNITVQGVIVAGSGPTTITTSVGKLIGDDTAYDATTWNGSNLAPTQNAIRDKLETLGSAAYTASTDYEAHSTNLDNWSAITTGSKAASGANSDITSLSGVTAITGGAGNMTLLSGTGASRTLILQTTTSGSTPTTALTLGADQSATFAGTVKWGTDNSADIGADSNRTRSIYVSTLYCVGGEMDFRTGGVNKVRMQGNTDGLLTLYNGAANGFTGLQLYTDTGLYRNGAGVLEINNGTAGQWGALKAGVRDAGTNTTTNGVTVGHQSSGTPTTSFGTGILLNANDSSTADVNLCQLSSLWTTATHNSNVSDFVLKLVNGSTTLAEQFRVTGAGDVAIGAVTPSARMTLPAGGTAAGTAPLKFTTQANPLSSVEQGTMELVGNSLQFTQKAKRRGVAMTQDVLTADVTVGNDSAESAAVITASHGANYLEVGKREEIRLDGIIAQRSNPSAQLTIRVKYAGSTIQTIVTPASTVIAANTPFQMNVTTTCRATGAGTGTMMVNSIFLIAGITVDPGVATLATGLDTTTAQDTTITFQWGETNSSDTITVNQGRVLCIEPSR